MKRNATIEALVRRKGQYLNDCNAYRLPPDYEAIKRSEYIAEG